MPSKSRISFEDRILVELGDDLGKNYFKMLQN
jgi:hypothetical protein